MILEGLVAFAAWVFLAGAVLVVLSAVPAVSRRRPGLLGIGFLVAVLSFVLVLLAWALPRWS